MGILRNLSYRLDSEVSPEHKYGQTDDWRSKGLGGGQFKRKDPGDDLVKKKKNRYVDMMFKLPDLRRSLGKETVAVNGGLR